jgi:hypothetical protein
MTPTPEQVRALVERLRGKPTEQRGSALDNLAGIIESLLEPEENSALFRYITQARADALDAADALEAVEAERKRLATKAMREAATRHLDHAREVGDAMAQVLEEARQRAETAEARVRELEQENARQGAIMKRSGT